MNSSTGKLVYIVTESCYSIFITFYIFSQFLCYFSTPNSWCRPERLKLLAMFGITKWFYSISVDALENTSVYTVDISLNLNVGYFAHVTALNSVAIIETINETIRIMVGSMKNCRKHVITVSQLNLCRQAFLFIQSLQTKIHWTLRLHLTWNHL